MVVRHLLGLLPAALIVAAAACGPMRRGGTPPPTVIVLTNESLEQAQVYIIAQGSSARRIGTVMTGHTDTLFVPPDLAARGGVMNIFARLLARSAIPQTGPVSIVQGQSYEVRIPSDAGLMSFLPMRP